MRYENEAIIITLFIILMINYYVSDSPYIIIVMIFVTDISLLLHDWVAI